ncbi:DUF6390 family protein [Rhodococcus sp. NPDC059234]|uniref:DUF6390 family protein n=1 Tax=Rhodococcus sp. NPDC059234 TaxID=3346781 RepID=UPI00366F40DF
MPTPGHRLFARYAYAPNALGYCGPEDTHTLESVACGSGGDADVPSLARRFSGAWPYQRLVAELSGIADPLDEEVGRAYWTGSELTDRIDRNRFGRRLLDRLAAQAGHYWAHLTPELLGEAAPTHAFHVFGVYPWSRLLGSGAPQPLQVLDSCRIGWGTVTEVREHDTVVRSSPLVFDGTALGLGPDRECVTRYRVPGGGTFVSDLSVGDRVAMHWDFVCDRLDTQQEASLEFWTRWQLERTNLRLAARAHND